MLLWLSTAFALEELSQWNALYDALLEESAWGNVDAALVGYEALATTLPLGDPVRAEALFWWGNSLFALGEADGARQTLLQGVRTGACALRCKALLAEIELQGASITTLPTHWAFNTQKHGIFHPWYYEDQGSIVIDTLEGDDDPALVWTTIVQRPKADRLVLSIDGAKPAATRLRFTIQSLNMDAFLQIVAVDTLGQEFGLAEPVRLPIEQSMSIDMLFEDLLAVKAPEQALNTENLSRIYLIDVTAMAGVSGGKNTLVLDDLFVQ